MSHLNWLSVYIVLSRLVCLSLKTADAIGAYWSFISRVGLLNYLLSFQNECISIVYYRPAPAISLNLLRIQQKPCILLEKATFICYLGELYNFSSDVDDVGLQQWCRHSFLWFRFRIIYKLPYTRSYFSHISALSLMMLNAHAPLFLTCGYRSMYAMLSTSRDRPTWGL